MMLTLWRERKSVTQAYDDFIRAAQQYGNSNDWQHAQEGVYYAEEQLYEPKENSTRQ